MKILVLGCTGQLGRCLNDQLSRTDHEVIYATREDIDITNFEMTRSQFLNISPDIVINAAAYTQVDRAEDDSEKANLINHIAVANIANICNQLGNWLIHVSTDYVFDGNSKTGYSENDKTNPQSIYGLTKLKGEHAVQTSGCKHIILRTSWVFSEYGNNFLKTILHLGKEKEELNIIVDQIGCPTYAHDIARCIIEIFSKLESKNNNDIYHFCGDIACSWFEFANKIFEQAHIKEIKVPSKINAISTSDYPQLANRPLSSILDCSKIKKDFGINASNWNEGIRQVINKIS